jgi:hypothetical protein
MLVWRTVQRLSGITLVDGILSRRPLYTQTGACLQTRMGEGIDVGLESRSETN